MVREEGIGSTRRLQWKCVESRVDSKRLHYGRFILSPLRKGQADTIGIAMRRVLLGEMEGTCIIHAKFDNVPHEYSSIPGMEESIQEILMNLKEIVLRSHLYGVRDALICVKGPKCVTAQDIISPPSVEIVDTTQHIANLTEAVDLRIELQIQRDRGYRIKSTNDSQAGSYPIDAVSIPVRNANYSIYSYGDGNEKQEILFLEIWTNGSLTPKEALYGASRNLIDLLIPFLHAEEENTNTNLEEKKNKFTLPFTSHDSLSNAKKNINGMTLKYLFIDQLELPSRVYNCLKRSNIHTLLDLLNQSQEDLMRIHYFRAEDVKQILSILQKRFAIHLPKN
uniref:DNA-directed RNA polymerase subunit alpha n=1 Tax=Najas filifolia TaxID=1561844 RepID=A0A0R5RST9_9LILI|nr:RNA polymerase alpha subunit [Najas filifolia]